jgi:chemotaxis protein methyltransferase CheR
MTAPGTAPSRQVENPALGEREFQFFSELIHSRTGICLKDSKRSMVASRLMRRLRALELADFARYRAYIEGGEDKEELTRLVNCLTTNKTSFFREEAQFEFLQGWLPRRAAERPAQMLRIWSAACSTGEEPYSIAVTALEALQEVSGLRILASDIDTEVLAAASRAVYPLASLDPVREPLRRRYFLRGTGDWQGHAMPKPAVTRQVDFRQLNLVDPRWPALGRFDAIFIRNAVIYFDRVTQRRLFERLAHLLEPGGLLFAGSSESLFWLSDLFLPVRHSIYRCKEALRSRL